MIKFCITQSRHDSRPIGSNASNKGGETNCHLRCEGLQLSRAARTLCRAYSQGETIQVALYILDRLELNSGLVYVHTQCGCCLAGIGGDHARGNMWSRASNHHTHCGHSYSILCSVIKRSRHQNICNVEHSPIL